jgi:hypothetical protein
MDEKQNTFPERRRIMKIDLTVKEYQALLELVYVGNIVFNSMKESADVNPEYFELLDKLTLHAAESREAQRLLRIDGDLVTYPHEFFDKCEEAIGAFMEETANNFGYEDDENYLLPEPHWSEFEGEAIPLMHLKISLKGIKPTIFREVIAPMYMTFHELHELIQSAFGWEDTHNYQFWFMNEIIRKNCEDHDDPSIPAELAELADFGIAKGDLIEYEYDLGDSWIHHIKVLKIYDSQEDEKFPRCIEAVRACPPEDIGGISGYAQMVNTLSQPDLPEYRELLDWLGSQYDPDFVSLDEINERIDQTFCVEERLLL